MSAAASTTSAPLPPLPASREDIHRGYFLPTGKQYRTLKDAYVVNSCVNDDGERVSQKLGQGGYGQVYAGTRLRDDLPVALKILRQKDIRAWETLNGRGVPLEIILLKKVSHLPCVVKLLDWLEEGSHFILILERPSPCEDLYDYIDRCGPLPEEVARDFMLQVLDMVKKCLSAGVIHRDIKDENILVTKDKSLYGRKTLKLIDFGSGTYLGREFDRYFDGGTQVYSPPECLSGGLGYRPITATVWSLGILLYDMVCGNIPFEDEDQIRAAKVVFKEERRLSVTCRALITKCLLKDPTKRPTIEVLASDPWFKVNHLAMPSVCDQQRSAPTDIPTSSLQSPFMPTIGSLDSTGSSYHSGSLVSSPREFGDAMVLPCLTKEEPRLSL